MSRVVVFGVFDLLHPGHLYFLQQAKKHGSHLTVVITRDERAIAEKGHDPFFNEKERLKLIGALRLVDKAILGDKKGEWKIIKKLKPDAICLGYDQNADWIKRCGPFKKMPHLITTRAYRPKYYSSSRIKIGVKKF